MGESKPDPGALASFVRKIFLHTENAQVAFSPEFTLCNACGRVERGLREDCPGCGSEDVDGITRITGYFTRTSSWNGGKRAELRDRVRVPGAGGEPTPFPLADPLAGPGRTSALPADRSSGTVPVGAGRLSG